MRLIDADLLLENLIDTAKNLPEEDRPPYLFCALLIEEEGKHPVDAVEVVRCKDCKHRKKYNGEYHRCSVFERTIKNDDYCSFGERGDTE